MYGWGYTIWWAQNVNEAEAHPKFKAFGLITADQLMMVKSSYMYQYVEQGLYYAFKVFVWHLGPDGKVETPVFFKWILLGLVSRVVPSKYEKDLSSANHNSHSLPIPRIQPMSGP